MSYRVLGLILILVVLGLVPFALIARSRAQQSPTPAPHGFLDMVSQPKFKPQQPNAMFADGRAMRPVLPGVVAHEDVQLPPEALTDPNGLRMVNGKPIELKDQAAWDRVMLGQQKGPNGQPELVTAVPPEIPVTMDLMKRGQERFGIYCTPCHGLSGYGDGMVARRARELQDGGGDAAAAWVQPTNYHTPDGRKWPVGHLFNVITNGVRTMPRYDKQISVYDRWAIAAYVKALQRSQYSKDSNDLPEAERANFK